jgi:hypothetical protein
VEIGMTRDDGTVSHPLDAARRLARQGLVKRVAQMACLWGLFGLVVGVATLPGAPNVVGVVAGMVAGLLVLLPFGVSLGLLGGEPGPTLFGGVSGAGLGVVTGLLSATGGTAHVASVALLGGAAAGATLHLASSGFFALFRAVTPAGRGR